MEVEENTIDEIIEVDFFIDITDQVCPMTFVKTKLLIESMPAGKIAEVRLKGAETLKNVPRSIEEHGHEILVLRRESDDGDIHGVHILLLRKH